MKWAVISVKPTKDYKLFLTFEGGKKRVFDFTPLLEDKINGIIFYTSWKNKGKY